MADVVLQINASLDGFSEDPTSSRR